MADISTRIGITNVVWAALLVIAILGVAFVILTVIAYRKMIDGTTLKANPLLLIVSQNGYASLSQFQIVLWTFLVGGSAIYVMALSGELIEITNGTLILLGISGAAAIGAKAHGANESANIKAGCRQCSGGKSRRRQDPGRKDSSGAECTGGCGRRTARRGRQTRRRTERGSKSRGA